jgi:hypothetical protein
MDAESRLNQDFPRFVLPLNTQKSSGNWYWLTNFSYKGY